MLSPFGSPHYDRAIASHIPVSGLSCVTTSVITVGNGINVRNELLVPNINTPHSVHKELGERARATVNEVI